MNIRFRQNYLKKMLCYNHKLLDLYEMCIYWKGIVVKKRHMILSVLFCAALILSAPNLARAEYNWETPTVNNWNLVEAGNLNYPDGTLIGNNGTGGGGVPAAVNVKSGENATITSDGTVTVVVRPKPGVVTRWLYGIYNYSSTGGATTQQTTRLDVDAALKIDAETAPTQSPGDEELASALYVRAHAAPGVGTPGASAVTVVDFKKDVSIKLVNKTANTGASDLNPNSTVAVQIASFNGGRNDVRFGAGLDIDTKATAEGRNVYGIRMEDQGPNGTGSSLKFEGNTTVRADATAEGRAWGVIGQAAGGTQTISTAAGTTLDITASQTGGQNYAEALKLSAFTHENADGILNATFDGDVRAKASSDYYAVGASLNALGNGTLTADFKGLNAVSNAKNYAYGLYLAAAKRGTNGGNIDATVGELSLKAKGSYIAKSISQNTATNGDSKLHVTGPADISAAPDSGAGADWAYGVDQSAAKRRSSARPGAISALVPLLRRKPTASL